jgi:hypothetical protein
MTQSRTALVALLAVWGVGVCAVDASAQDAAAAEATTFTDRVWVEEGGDESRPGVMKIFLSDGTLVQDSCWETHRFSPWEMTSETTVRWNEDGMDITATIASLTAQELVLVLDLGADKVEQRFVPAPVPYVCPDVPR